MTMAKHQLHVIMNYTNLQNLDDDNQHPSRSKSDSENLYHKSKYLNFQFFNKLTTLFYLPDIGTASNFPTFFADKSHSSPHFEYVQAFSKNTRTKYDLRP